MGIKGTGGENYGKTGSVPRPRGGSGSGGRNDYPNDLKAGKGVGKRINNGNPMCEAPVAREKAKKNKLPKTVCYAQNPKSV
jgi:hypothetical protein